MSVKAFTQALAALLLALFVAGCVSKPQMSLSDNISAYEAIEKIKLESEQAYDKASIERLIVLHKIILKEDPKNIASLSALAQLNTFMGAAYSDSISDKRMHFKSAMRYAEKIMIQNPEFAQRRKAGEKPWTASDALTKNEADAMGWWSTALLYYFDEGIIEILKPMNLRHVARSKVMMDQLAKVKPDWENGTNYFNLSIYYHALPAIAGGSKKKSQEYLLKAEQAGPNKLLVPWGKAKYYYPYQLKRKEAVSELNWVLAQNVQEDSGELYAWRVYFQSQARQMLDELEE